MISLSIVSTTSIFSNFFDRLSYSSKVLSSNFVFSLLMSSFFKIFASDSITALAYPGIKSSKCSRIMKLIFFERLYWCITVSLIFFGLLSLSSYYWSRTKPNSNISFTDLTPISKLTQFFYLILTRCSRSSGILIVISGRSILTTILLSKQNCLVDSQNPVIISKIKKLIVLSYTIFYFFSSLKSIE